MKDRQKEKVWFEIFEQDDGDWTIIAHWSDGKEVDLYNKIGLPLPKGFTSKQKDYAKAVLTQFEMDNVEYRYSVMLELVPLARTLKLNYLDKIQEYVENKLK